MAREARAAGRGWCWWRDATRASTSASSSTEIDEQWSIGDYVLSGGELPALVVIDAIARLMPGTLGQRGIGGTGVVQRRAAGLAALHAAGRDGRAAVPAVLASGDHAAIRRWRLQQALGRTWLRRPELLERRGMSDEERACWKNSRRTCAPARVESKTVKLW
jgi:tRNA (guanine37-N1)-methyltransferase